MVDGYGSDFQRNEHRRAWRWTRKQALGDTPTRDADNHYHIRRDVQWAPLRSGLQSLLGVQHSVQTSHTLPSLPLHARKCLWLRCRRIGVGAYR